MTLSDPELRSGRNLVRWIVGGVVVALVLGIALFPRGASPAQRQCKGKYAEAHSRADTLRVDSWIVEMPARGGKRTCGDVLGYHS